MPSDKQIKGHPAPSKLEDMASLPEISGLNTVSGLRNTGGTILQYLDVLASFCLDAEQKVVEIAEAASSEDCTRYTILVHGLKGASLSVGATDLAALAQTLEEAGEAKDIATIKRKTEALISELSELAAQIRPVLVTEPSTNEVASREDLQIGTLQEALRQMDITVVNEMLAAYARLPLDAAMKEIITKIDQSVLLFEYDEAIELTNQLA
jgi:HPt (histidine-containing phosphotransfer) domain-containing protein